MLPISNFLKWNFLTFEDNVNEKKEYEKTFNNIIQTRIIYV